MTNSSPETGGPLETSSPSELSRFIWRAGDPVAPLRRHLVEGGVLIIPTESSYGLAVDPRSADGVEAIYQLKGRERGNPLPVVAAHRQHILDLGVASSADGLDRACELWPAPLSLVLPIDAPLAATAGRRTLAVRIPAHPPLLRLLHDLGCPLTATSANLSGRPAIVDPDDLTDWLEEGTCRLVDGGVLPGGPPSTLLRPHDGRVNILRRGAFDPADWPSASEAAEETNSIP